MINSYLLVKLRSVLRDFRRKTLTARFRNVPKNICYFTNRGWHLHPTSAYNKNKDVYIFWCSILQCGHQSIISWAAHVEWVSYASSFGNFWRDVLVQFFAWVELVASRRSVVDMNDYRRQYSRNEMILLLYKIQWRITLVWVLLAS